MLSVKYTQAYDVLPSAMLMANADPSAFKFAAHYVYLAQRAKTKLSRREQQCIVLLVEGLSAKEIGQRLSISPRTAEVYISRLKQRFGAKNKTHLVKRLIDAGVI